MSLEVRLLMWMLLLCAQALCTSCRHAGKDASPMLGEEAVTEVMTASQWPGSKHLVVEIETSHEEGEVLVLTGEGEFDYAVDWDDDGLFDEEGLTGSATHRYGVPGRYRIRIAGRLPHVRWCAHVNEETYWLLPQQIMDVRQWGWVKWGSMEGMFKHCSLLKTWSASDVPRLEDVRDMSEMFLGASAFDQPLERWDVSGVRSMHRMFMRAMAFDQPLERWDVSNVRSMRLMFASAESFNQPLDGWDVSRVIDMMGMFSIATAFDQPLKSWDVSRVEELSHLFLGASSLSLTHLQETLNAWESARLDPARRVDLMPR